jgi:hypothetical protein
MLLLKVENFELQNFFSTENLSANHILQNFLSMENFPAWEWALKVVSHFNHIVTYGNISSCADVISSVLMLREQKNKEIHCASVRYDTVEVENSLESKHYLALDCRKSLLAMHFH